jgi:hypothetical protein
VAQGYFPRVILGVWLRRPQEMAILIRDNEQGETILEYTIGAGEVQETETYIPEDVVADVLMYAAVDVESIGCKDDWCKECNPMRTAWWKAMNSLSIKTRQATQALMRDANVALVPGPFEEEEVSVVSITQHG